MSDGNGVNKFSGHCKMRDVFIGSECFTNSKKTSTYQNRRFGRRSFCAYSGPVCLFISFAFCILNFYVRVVTS